MKKPILNLFLVAFIGIAFAGCTWKLFPTQKNSEPTEAGMVVEEKIEKASDSGQIVYPDKIEENILVFQSTTADQTALKLLQDNAEVEYDEYDFGVMVNSINGLTSDSGHYWAFYVNGEYSQQGADQTVLAVDDVLEWRYE